MSTFGTAVVIDVAPHGSVEPVVASLGGHGSYVRTLPDSGWMRFTTGFGEIGQVEVISALVAAAGTARAAVAEDNDEYGALWVVLSADRGVVSTIHRRYILNADPSDPADVALALEDFEGADPRALDVGGVTAAAAAAKVFEVDVAPMIRAEEGAHTAHEELGVVGGPFPWWSALRLVWPGPEAGVEVSA